MSKIALSGNASGTGTFTFASPNSNTDRTLSLPDQTGTLLTGSGAISVNASAPVPSVSVDASGNLLVGTTSSTFSVSPSSTGLQVKSTGQIWPNTAYASQDNIVCATTGSVSGTHTFISFYAGGTSRGSINFNGSTLSYSTSSDYRLKENIQPMTSALATVAQLNPVTYTWKDGGFAGQGFIAHELAEVVPDAVTGEKDAVDADGNPQYQGIDTSFLVATLTAAIQELKAIVDAQGAEIAALKGQA